MTSAWLVLGLNQSMLLGLGLALLLRQLRFLLQPGNLGFRLGRFLLGQLLDLLIGDFLQLVEVFIDRAERAGSKVHIKEVLPDFLTDFGDISGNLLLGG